ncbi:hypothetical protein [Lactiplantibacillus carotarum]|uniref:hypothetical protein n=1 Tax=Lactiplantibacillus carotarum TaxID=2993456 RepID=UPI00298F14C4|nr:hypothetical protein [Lactiplantibacillus carotarum]
MSSSQHQSGRSSQKAANSSSLNTTNDLVVSDIGPGTRAMAVTYYASHHVDQVGQHSWQKMNQVYLKKMGTIIASKEHVDLMNKPGTGQAYYVVPRDEKVGTAQLASYPCYTVQNNQKINVYQPGQGHKAVLTVSLKTVIRYINHERQADKIREIGQMIVFTDQSNVVKSKRASK